MTTEMKNTTRRRFLGLAGIAGAGAVLTGIPAAALSVPTADTTLLNFVLNLKYLQAAYYLCALGRLDELTAAGGDARKVSSSLSGRGMTVYSPFLSQYFGEIADDEVAQVRLLHTHLGRDAQLQPQIDLETAFSKLASGSRSQKTAFNPFESELHFLQGAALLEDISMAALHGVSAQGMSAPTPELLAADAKHAGMVRLMLHQHAGAAGLHLQEVLQGGLLGQITPLAGTHPRQIADVLMGAGLHKGGFFPQGLSGQFQGLYQG